MTEEYHEVLNHLLFHKVLEEDGTGKVDEYVALLERVQAGYTFAEEARFERHIASVFRLVMEQSFDPWDIDLARFSKAYLQRVRRLGSVNFITAGRLIHLAWSVLKLKSELTLSGAAPVNPSAGEAFEEWDIGPDFYADPGDVDFTHDLLQTANPPLQEAFHREVTRPVTLMDLLHAFTQAFQESSVAVARPRGPPPLRPEEIREKVHQEDLEEDLRRTWAAITGLDQDVVGLSQLPHRDAWERATVFLSILFLSRLGWIEIWQEDFPWGEVYLRPLRTEAADPPPLAPLAAEVA